MAGIEADADLVDIEGAEDPHEVAGAAGEQMRQHVFEHEAEAEAAAVVVEAVEDLDGVLEPHETFVLGQDRFFGTGMEDEVAHVEESGGFGGFDEFGHGEVAGGFVEGGDVDGGGERGVEGVGLESQLMNPLARPADGVAVVVVEMGRVGADFEAVEAAVPDGFEAVEDTGLPEAAGGKPNGPVAHTVILVSRRSRSSARFARQSGTRQ